MKKKYDIFMCCSRQDRNIANAINYALRGHGYSTFYDVEDLAAFDFQDQILDAVKNSKIFLYLYVYAR